MRTYDSWPTQPPKPTPRFLARSGFFYLGNSDRTQCFSCAGIVKDWSATDNVHDCHARFFPRCRMVLGIDSGNIPEIAADQVGTFFVFRMFEVLLMLQNDYMNAYCLFLVCFGIGFCCVTTVFFYKITFKVGKCVL